jgi:hypothetical protein
MCANVTMPRRAIQDDALKKTFWPTEYPTLCATRWCDNSRMCVSSVTQE